MSQIPVIWQIFKLYETLGMESYTIVQEKSWNQ